MNISEEAKRNDGRLLDLAMYEETKGMMLQRPPEVIMERFGYFKRLVMRGSFTIEDLEERIFSRYGFITKKSKKGPQAPVNGNDEDILKQMNSFINGDKPENGENNG